MALSRKPLHPEKRVTILRTINPPLGIRKMYTFWRLASGPYEMDEELIKWFAECFYKIIIGEDPSKALGCNRPRGRQQTSKEFYDRHETAYLVAREILFGKSKNAALKKVAADLKKSKNTVESHYLQFEKEATEWALYQHDTEYSGPFLVKGYIPSLPYLPSIE